MTKPFIEDCFIGNYPVTQEFGENPKNYAQFGMKGHNGIDFGIPSNTQLIASTQGQVIKVASDPNGYGNFVEILDDIQRCATLYAHLDHAVVKVGDRVVQGQLIGLSDNTGNSTGPHLHFGFCLTDDNGIRLNQDNGYFGWLNPNTSANWIIENPSAPTLPTDTQDQSVLLDQLRIERDTNWNLYQSERQAKIDLEDQIDAKNKSFDAVTKENLELKEQVKTLTDQHSTDLEALQGLKQENKTLSDGNVVLLEKIAFLEKNSTTPVYTGFKLWLYNTFLK